MSIWKRNQYVKVNLRRCRSTQFRGMVRTETKKKKNHQTTRQHSRFWLSILYCPTGQVKGYSPPPPQCHHPYHSHENTQHIKSAYQLLETELKSLRGLFHLIHHDSLVKLMLLLLSSNYYRWRNQSRKKLHNLPKVNIK